MAQGARLRSWSHPVYTHPVVTWLICSVTASETNDHLLTYNLTLLIIPNAVGNETYSIGLTDAFEK